jgi:hypothetical protein
MAYNIGGVNIETLAETAATSDPRSASGLSTSTQFTFGGNTYQDATGRKFIVNQAGYIYSEDVNNGKYKSLGFFNLARRGCRPYTRKIWDTFTPSTYYVNRFSDGEVWVATTPNSRSGTRISTTTQNIQYVFTMLIAGGGGGGGGANTKAGGGGGGGSFAFLCHRLVDNWIYRLYVGAGGAAGAVKTDGGVGGQCQAAMFRDTNYSSSGVTTFNIFGGSGGISGSDDGQGGEGGRMGTPYTGTYMHVIDQLAGMSGGYRGNAGASSPNSYTTGYNTENSRLNFGSGAGGTAPGSGGGGGSGWYFGTNHAGGTGGDGGAGGNGAAGAGGGGGAWMLFSGYAAGSGGGGYAALFY